VPVLRKLRAVDDRESGGASGSSQANAAGETAGASVRDGAGLDGAELDGAELDAEKPGDQDPGGGELDGRVGDGASAADCAKPPGVQTSADGETGAQDGRAMLSAGNAGTPSTTVASAPPLRPRSWAESAAGPSGAGESFVVSKSASLAGVSLVATGPNAVRSDTLPLAGSVVTGAAATAGFCGASLGVAALMPDAWVSSPFSSSGSSPSTREVTMVGEAPPEPSGPFVRLSKPSSLWS
jgi:hypothetical protein